MKTLFGVHAQVSCIVFGVSWWFVDFQPLVKLFDVSYFQVLTVQSHSEQDRKITVSLSALEVGPIAYIYLLA